MSSRIARQALVILLSGIALGVGFRFAQVWYQGGSVDPRCVLGFDGYVEHHIQDVNLHSHVECEYQSWAAAP